MKTHFFITVFMLLLCGTFSCKTPDDTPTEVQAKEVSGSIGIPTVWSHTAGATMDYVVTGSINVTSSLTIEEGTIIKLKPNVNISVTENGYIRGNGTKDNPITITKCNKENWGTIFLYSRSDSNALSFCNILNGGQFEGMLNVGGSNYIGKIAINNCIFSNSASAGVKFVYGNISALNDNIFTNNSTGIQIQGVHSINTISSFSNNTFTNNTEYPIIISNKMVNYLNNNNNITGNIRDTILVLNQFGGDTDTAQWNKMNVPYLIKEHMYSYFNLIKPGTVIVIAKTEFNCTLTALGTQQDSIKFIFQNEGSLKLYNNSLLKYCVIDGGGGNNVNCDTVWSSDKGTIVCNNNDIIITNCRISNSSGYGMIKCPQTQVIEKDNIFWGNALGNKNW